MTKIFKYLSFSLILLTGCYKEEEISLSPLCEKENIVLYLNSKPLNTEIACKGEKRAIGLMNRKYLEENSGMLFIFPKKDIHPFWMKNTYIPLSIAYIDEKWNIVDIKDMFPLDETPIYPAYSALYALEVNKNWFFKNNINIGDKIFIK